MFFVDKYLPQSADDILFHQEEINKLKTMSKDDSIPHIIFYGPDGSGKKTIIRLFLEMIYGKNINKLVDTEYNVTGSGNSNTQVIIKQSNYHIVIEPNNNNFDRYLIQDVVKEYAKRIPLNIFTANKSFKTVFINNVDNLSYYAQTSLRRTLEKYSGTCRFIMLSKSLSKVIDPLRSRCYCFRVKCPTDDEILTTLLQISSKEYIKLSLEQYSEILEKSSGNIKKAIWLLELLKFGEGIETSYDEILSNIVMLILKLDAKTILIIRDLFYKIMITNIDGTTIIKDVLDLLLQSNMISDNSKIKIIELASKYEHNLILGRREIKHLEAFVIGVKSILNKFDKNTILNGLSQNRKVTNNRKIIRNKKLIKEKYV